MKKICIKTFKIESSRAFSDFENLSSASRTRETRGSHPEVPLFVIDDRKQSRQHHHTY